MSDHEVPKFVRGAPACAFCARALSDTDTVAAITLPSSAHGRRFFSAHAECLRQTMRPEIAQFMDLADIPPGLGHVLPRLA
jgi:hypothetical protein